MTPPPGHIRSDGRGGLRVVIEEVEHWVAPVRLTGGAKWQCANCGEIVPYEQIINPRQCQCGSWSYRPIYDQAALAEADRRRSR